MTSCPYELELKHRIFRIYLSTDRRIPLLIEANGMDDLGFLVGEVDYFVVTRSNPILIQAIVRTDTLE